MNRYLLQLAIFLLLTPFSAQSQEDGTTILYLEPSETGAIFAAVEDAEIARLNPQPLPDGSSSEWQWIELPGQFVGYIKSKEVKKDLSISPGSPIFLRKESSSPVLSTVSDESEIEIIRPGPEWVTVNFIGAVPAYFKSDRTSNLFVTETAPLAPPVIEETVIIDAPLLTPETYEETAILEPSSLQDETIVLDEPAPIQPVVQPQDEIIFADSIEPLQQRPFKSSKQTNKTTQAPRYFEGRLKSSRGFLDFFKLRKPKFPYILEGPDKKPIAYVNLDSSLLLKTLDAYLNNYVTLQGTVESTNGSPGLIIHTLYITAK